MGKSLFGCWCKGFLFFFFIFKRNFQVARMRNYFFVVLLAIVFSVHYQIVECAEKMDLDGLRNMLKPMSKSCKRRTGVSDELVENTHNGVFPRDRALMCYYKCLSIMLKIMDKNGGVSIENVKRQLELLVASEYVPRMKEIGMQCFEEVKPNSDACVYAFEFVVCGYKLDKSLYILP